MYMVYVHELTEVFNTNRVEPCFNSYFPISMIVIIVRQMFRSSVFFTFPKNVNVTYLGRITHVPNTGSLKFPVGSIS